MAQPVDIPGSLATLAPAVQHLLPLFAIGVAILLAIGAFEGLCNAIDKRRKYKPPTHLAPGRVSLRTAGALILGVPLLLVGGAYVATLF